MQTLMPETHAREGSAILAQRGVLLYDEPPFAGAAGVRRRQLPSMLDELLSAPGSEERRACVAAILRAMDFDWLGYGRVQVMPKGVLPVAFCVSHGDPIWQRRYVAEAYHEVDPRITMALGSSLPCAWTLDELALAAGPDPKAQRFLQDLRSTGMRSGVILALGGPQPQERTLVSLLSRQETLVREANDTRLSQVLMLGMCLHEFYTRYAPPPLDAAEAAAELTRTQRAILQCLLRGMADKQIASCLALSPHTVDYHMRQLRKRFGARNRTQLMPAALRQTEGSMEVSRTSAARATALDAL
jgi:DNA-binding CsgD family transcriptional regulator